AGFPENAIETFENSYRYQPLFIECDVRMTSDSVLVLLHDDTLDRTTTGSGKVAEVRFSDLKDLLLKDPDGETTSYRCATLDQAGEWGARKERVTSAVERGEPEPRVIDAIRPTQAQAYCVVSTDNSEQAATVHKLSPDLMTSASIPAREDLLRLGSLTV